MWFTYRYRGLSSHCSSCCTGCTLSCSGICFQNHISHHIFPCKMWIQLKRKEKKHTTGNEGKATFLYNSALSYVIIIHNRRVSCVTNLCIFQHNLNNSLCSAHRMGYTDRRSYCLFHNHTDPDRSPGNLQVNALASQ